MIVNGVDRESLRAPLSVESLLESLGIQPRGIAVAINGEIARRSLWATTFVGPHDAVEIFTAVAGG